MDSYLVHQKEPSGWWYWMILLGAIIYGVLHIWLVGIPLLKEEIKPWLN